MMKIEPMTAAEYRSHLSCPPVTALGKRIHAALEERERLLAERREAAIQARVDECNAIPSSYSCGESDTPGACWDCYQFEKDQRRSAEERLAQDADDAALGALVRRIGEHPMADGLAFRVSAKPDPIHFYYKWRESALVEALDHLDSLLPKEPEVVVKLGGRTWTFGTSPVGNTNVWWRPGDGTSYVTASGELELALNALNALGGGK